MVGGRPTDSVRQGLDALAALGWSRWTPTEGDVEVWYRAGVDHHGRGADVWVTDDGLTAYAGHLWPKGGGWTGPPTDTVRELAVRLPHTDLAGVPERFGGQYVVVTVDARGRGGVVTDPLGLRPLYLARADHTAVAGTTASTVAGIVAGGRLPPRDPMVASWLGHFGFVIGDGTGWLDVRSVVPGSFVRLAGDLSIERWCEAPWRGSGDGRRGSTTPSRQWSSR